jgi:hypothetical protein
MQAKQCWSKIIQYKKLLVFLTTKTDKWNLCESKQKKTLKALEFIVLIEAKRFNIEMKIKAI